MSWTDERIDRLKTMWENGLTASQIAVELGGVSRNAVIGKAHRLELQARPSPVKGNDSDGTKAEPRKAAAPKPKAAAPAAPAAAPDPFAAPPAMAPAAGATPAAPAAVDPFAPAPAK